MYTVEVTDNCIEIHLLTCLDTLSLFWLRQFKCVDLNGETLLPRGQDWELRYFAYIQTIRRVKMPPKYLVVVYETTKRLVATDSRPLAIASHPCKIMER